MAMSAFHAEAADEPMDTVYFYDTWKQMLNVEPVAMFVNPQLYLESPCELYIMTNDPNLDKVIEKEHIAISLGDSIWFINTYYLDKHFGGDAARLNGFAPVYFNQKLAYVTYTANLSVKDLLFGESEDKEFGYDYSIDLYNIDFQNHMVNKVTPGTLSQMLEDYHDLQMRYEGMKDYKKRAIIEDYYFKYIDRATADIMHPYILDLVE